MKKLFTILILLGVTAFGQIFAPEGLNMPGSYDGYTQPPSINAFAGIQKTGGELLVITTGTRRYKTTLNVAASGGDITGGTYTWLFTSGPTSNYYNNKWNDVTVTMNTLQTYTKQAGGSDNSVTVTNGKWYTVIFKDVGYVNTQAIWMETTGEPITIADGGVSYLPVPAPGNPVTVNITTSATPATEEKIYVRYTTDNWANSSFVQATGSGTSWSAVIPGAGNTGTTDNHFYVMTTTVATPNHADADMQTINFTNNSGLNYPLPVELTSFNAKVSDNGLVDLKWETATEVNNYGFEVERKTANDDWSKIGFVEGHNSTNSPKYYSFSDKPVGTGKIAYRLKQIDNDGQFEYSPVVEVLVDNLPNGFVLEQNYPNPFNPETSIRFALKEDTKATLKVYNSLGAEIATLFDGTAEAGRYYDVKFGGSELASGFYIYKLVAGEYVSVKKMLLMK